MTSTFGALQVSALQSHSYVEDGLESPSSLLLPSLPRACSLARAVQEEIKLEVRLSTS